MDKLNVNLMAFDLDDTLLNDERKISDKNVEVLRRCAQRGIYIVLCSGRAEDAIRPFVSRLNIAALKSGRFVISTNGCSIFDMHERKQIFKRMVSPDILKYVHSEAQKMGFETEVYTDDVIYCSKKNEWTTKDASMCGLKLVEPEN